MLFNILVISSAFAFLFYGISFFANYGMKEEFERYGLNKFRKIIGFLQLLGGSGLLIGFIWHPILIVSAGGLALLMLIGFCVRVKMKDGFLQSIPSLIFMILNGYICLFSLYH